jgi:hypothetical protein
MNTRIGLKVAALGLMLAVAGCRSAADKANDAAMAQAKQQAAATGVAQQVVYTDRDGNTVTSIVQPPAPGQTTEQITTTKTSKAQTTSSAAPGAAPAPAPANGPVVSTYQSGQTPQASQPLQSDGSAPPPPSGAGYGAAGPAPTAAPANGAPNGPTVTPMQPANIEVPRGTTLAIRINQHISVKTSRPGDQFTGEVVRDVIPDGSNQVAIPHGTPVNGVIDEAHRRGHFKGRSVLELRLTSMELNGQRYNLDTRDNVRTKKGKGKRSAAFIGGGTGLGMLVGGVATGGVGLVVGGLVGGGAGTALGGLTGNRDIEIPAESVMDFRLADDLAVQPPQ